MIIILTVCSIFFLAWVAMIAIHILANKYDKLSYKYADEYERLNTEFYCCEDKEEKENLRKKRDEVYEWKHTYRNKCFALTEWDVFENGAFALAIALSIIIVLPITIPAICTQATANKYEVEMNMRRDALIADYEAYKNSTTYDTTNIHERIADFNIELHNTKYWANNPLTSWYNPYTVNNIQEINFE